MAGTRDGAARCGVAGRTELAGDNVVEDGFEVIEEDSIGGTLENQCEAPVGVDATACGDFCGADGDISQQEGDG